MKNTLLKTGFLAGALLLTGALKAQLSEGGKPYSFGKFFKPTSLVPVVRMPAVDVDALLAEDAANDGVETKPFRFGYDHITNLDLYNSGVWTNLPNGDRIWQLQVKSQNATSMNLSFRNFFIPQGAKLFVYTPDHQNIIGAMTSANNNEANEQGTDLLPGDEVIIEYFEPAAVSGQGTLTLWRVTHGYRGLSPFLHRMEKAFGDAGTCQINVACSLGTGWEDQIRSVACIVSGGEICSGALVNNTANDGTPYFLTANHCTGGGGVTSWVFRFNWQSPTCPDPSSSPSTANSISGCTVKAQTTMSDFCLVQLNSTPPASYNVYYSGWSRSTTPATYMMGIHHPSGDIKKISEAASTATATTWGSPSAQVWDVGLWTQACTEPGSSGSPLFDQDHRIIGQLYGGPSACGATGSNLKDYYGRFNISWTGGGTSSTRLSDWLDPAASDPAYIDGYDPNFVPPSFADDAGISNISSPASGSSSCATTSNVTVSIKNFGSSALTSATINYQLDGGPVQTQAWSGSLATYASASVTLPALTGLSVSAHTLVVYTTNPNGVSDPNTSNDQTSVGFTTIAPSPTGTLPVANGFESAFPGTGFSVTNGGAAYTWVQNTSVGGFGLTTKCASIDNYSNDFTGDSDYLNTAYLDMTSVTGAVQLTFDVAYAPYDATYFDSLKVWVSTNCGTPALVYAKGNTSLGTAPAYNSGKFVPTASQWRNESINLSSYAGMSNVRVSFENKSGYGQPVYIDNINLSAATGTINLADFSSSIQMYPNPAGTNVTLNLPVAFSQYRITVSNSIGQQVMTSTVPGSAMNAGLDVSALKPGIYLVTVENNGQKVVKKLVKE